jgi:Ca2+-binding RTX toxin-like protein
MESIFSRFTLPGFGVTITDKPGGHSLKGTSYIDTIFAEDGNDIVHAGAGLQDLVMGGDGNDTIYGEAGLDIIHGDKGNDKIYGGVGNDSLWGEEGIDTIYGGAGNDAIYLASGKDWAKGEAGKDTFVADGTNIAGGLGIDTIADFHSANDSQHDKLDLRAWGFKWAYHDKGMEDGFEIVKVGANTEIHMTNQFWGTGTIILKGVSVASISVSDFVI